jgi:CysZ protein
MIQSFTAWLAWPDLHLGGFDCGLCLDHYGLEPTGLSRSGKGDFLRDVLAGKLPNIGGVLFTLVLFIWLMLSIACAIISLFLEEVAQTVEARHDPNLPATKDTKLQDQILATLGVFGILFVGNFGALILSIFMPFLAPFIFWATNGYLLGWEYFQMAATRRMSRNDANLLFQRYRSAIWFAEILMAIPLSVPIMGLFIPSPEAATFTHQFGRLRALPSD